MAAPDGSVWAGVSPLGAGPDPRVGAIARSTDGGRTWAPVGEGWGGWATRALVVGPDGRVWAATDVGIWRTAAPAFAVAGEGGPTGVPPSGVGVRVYPNPSAGRVTVEVSLAAPGRVRVAAYDALGREVATVWDGPSADGRRLSVDVSGWPAGVYVVRAVGPGGASASARLTVTR